MADGIKTITGKTHLTLQITIRKESETLLMVFLGLAI